MQENHPDTTPFHALFEHAAEGILLARESGEIVLVNPAAAAMFGYERAGLEGQKIEILVPETFRKGHSRHRDNFHQNPYPRNMGLGLSLNGQRRDGSVFPVEISLSPYRTEDGGFVIAFVVDITLREQLAAQRAEMALELEREKEIGHLKSRFVSIASHEFRTPLSTILSSASLVNSYAERGDIPAIQKHAGRIKNSVGNLQNILNEFLSLGRIEDGRVETRPEDVNLRELAQEVEEDLQSILRKDQTLSCQHTGEDMVYLDKNLLRIILSNLVANAIKYSPEGSPIEVFCSVEKGKGTEIRVRDRGIGISEYDQEHLFERFFRASNSGSVSGTGLGLYIVKRYAELLGGTVGFTSRVGEGSEFWVRF